MQRIKRKYGKKRMKINMNIRDSPEINLKYGAPLNTAMRIVIPLLILLFLLVSIISCEQQESSTIKIGVIMPLTGSGAVYGEWGKNALEIAKDEINLEGGVHGRPIELIYEDGKFQISDSTTAFKKLADTDQVKFVMTIGSGPAVAIEPLANENHMIQMDFSATTSKYSTENDYTFRTALKATQFGLDGARLLKDSPFNANKVGVLYINNEQGQDIKTQFTQAAKDQGLALAVTEKFDQDATDFRTQLLKIEESKPDWIFLISHVTEAGRLVKQMNDLGMTTPIFSHVFSIEGESFFVGAGNDFKNTVVYMAPKYDPADPDARIKKYNAEYSRRYGKPSEYFGAFGYDGLKVTVAAMRQCENPEDTDCVREKLFQTRGFPGLAGSISFDKYGDTNKELMLKTIVNGTFVPFHQ